MNKLSAIRVIVDPVAIVHSCVDKAAALAEKFDARVDLLICDTKAARETRELPRLQKGNSERSIVEPEVLMRKLAATLRSRHIEVTTCIDFVEPLHEGLLKHLRNSGADLVVKDTHHHSFIKRTFLTNTDWHLIRGCSAPLLLTKAAPWSAHPTIVAALDPGHVNDKPATLDHELLKWGSLLCKQLHGTQHTAHAYMPMSILAPASAGMMPPIVGDVTPEALKAETAVKFNELRAVTRDYAIDDANIHVEFGTPGEYLPRITEQLHADVLITGVVSRSSIARAFLGNTAEQVLERTSCDLLVVKPVDFSQDLPF